MRVDAKLYPSQAALHALGAYAVGDVRDEAGDLVAYDVSPDVDLTGYAAKAAEALVGLKTVLKGLVDGAAEALRLTLITPGSGQAMEYQEAYSEAVAVETALQANPGATFDRAKFPMLSASIGFDLDPGTGTPTVDVPGEARAVLAAYEAYQRAGAAIRAVRLAGKAGIDAAADEAAARAALAAIVWPKLA